jgi:predicted TPR repeat methyltransferase
LVPRQPIQALSLCDALLALDPEEGTLDNTLNTVISSEFKKFDLIVVAAVLVYFGQLDSLLDTFADISAITAGLILSSERASEERGTAGLAVDAVGAICSYKEACGGGST